MVVVVPPVEEVHSGVVQPEVVVDDVHENGDPMVVGGPDKCAEEVGAAVVGLDGEDRRAVVPPRRLTGKLGRWQHEHCRDPQPCQVRQLLDHLLQASARSLVERPNVQFIDDEVVPSGHAEGAGSPVERRVVDHAVAVGVAHLARIEIGAPQGLAGEAGE